jgi:GDP-L-fucose synthase
LKYNYIDISELVFNINKPDGTLEKLTNVSKLHQLGWHHKIELEEGINLMYEWYTNATKE